MSEFCGWTWLRIRGMDADGVREHAQREDPGRGIGDIVLLLACVAAVVGVGFLLLASSDPQEAPRDALVGVLAVIGSWFVAHMLYTLRYAREHVAGSVACAGRRHPPARTAHAPESHHPCS